MLIEVDDKIISTQIFDRSFVCDLNACKGACCIEGDAGAPLTLEEVDVLEETFEKIKPYMRKEGIEIIEKQGVFYMDQDNEPVTSLVNDAECAFVFFDDKGITKCAVEQAYIDGETDFKKPISCHLYPIRVKKYNDFEALSYDVWNICSDACSLGEKLAVPVYQFLKEPLIRAFGEPFFKELELVSKEINENKK